DGVREIYRTDLATGQRLKLNPVLAPDEDVVEDVLDPTGKRAVFVTASEKAPSVRLWSSELETGTLSEIFPPLEGTTATLFSFDPAGQSRYFAAALDTPQILELYRRNLETGETIKVSGPLPPGWSVTS